VINVELFQQLYLAGNRQNRDRIRGLNAFTKRIASSWILLKSTAVRRSRQALARQRSARRRQIRQFLGMLSKDSEILLLQIFDCETGEVHDHRQCDHFHANPDGLVPRIREIRLLPAGKPGMTPNISQSAASLEIAHTWRACKDKWIFPKSLWFKYSSTKALASQLLTPDY
jgi:hypothetical protein